MRKPRSRRSSVVIPSCRCVARANSASGKRNYRRHGTCCLTAGLEVHTGKVLGLVTPKPGASEEHTLVAPTQSDPAGGRISIESPAGSGDAGRMGGWCRASAGRCASRGRSCQRINSNLPESQQGSDGMGCSDVTAGDQAWYVVQRYPFHPV